MFKNMSKKLIVIYSWLAFIVVWALVYVSKISFAAFNFNTCTLKRFFGLNCIACGGTRATDKLIHFDFVSAFTYNPLYVILLIIFFVYAIIISIGILVGKDLRVHPNKKVTKLLVTLLIATCILFSIIRNTPIYLKYFYF